MCSAHFLAFHQGAALASEVGEEASWGIAGGGGSQDASCTEAVHKSVS